MLDAIQDRLRKGTVISAKLIIPAIGIILGAEDGRGSPASPMEKLQNVMLFGFSWFQQEPFINDQQDRVGIFPLDFLVCAIVTCHLQFQEQIRKPYILRFVTLPALSNTIITVLILNLAKVMNMFESVFVLYNNAVYSVSDVISTYIYRQTFAIALPNYGYSTAVGLFKSLVGCVLVLICNWASKKTRGRGIV